MELARGKRRVMYPKDMIDLIEERLCRDKNHNLACLQISVSNEGDLDPVPTRRRVPARP